MAFAGAPPATGLSGMPFAAAAPAAMTMLLSICARGSMTALPPVQKSLPMVTGKTAVTRYNLPFAPFSGAL